MADPERFYADPDPNFQVDADPATDPDPNPNPFTRVRKFFSNLHLLFPKSSKTFHVQFLSKNAGGRVSVRGEG